MIKLPGRFNLLLNKYVMSLIVFVVWISFCDRNDLLTQWDRKQELNKLENSSSYYEKEIEETKKYLTDLDNNPVMLEKIARENFFLKKPNEQVFVVVEQSEEKTD